MRRPEYLYLHEMRDAVVRIIDIVDERARRAGSRLRRPAGQLRITP